MEPDKIVTLDIKIKIMKRIIVFTLLLTHFSCINAEDKSFYFNTSFSVKLFVKVAGQGIPCVFVHGGPGSNSYYYEGVLSAPLIEKHVQMIYYDQRGCGRSDSAKNENYSLARMEKDLEELRQYLGLKQWAVMGHSFGGIIATKYAYDYPKSVSALLMIHCTLNMYYSVSSPLEFGLNELQIKDQSAYRDTSKPLMDRVNMIHQQLTNNGVWYKIMFRNQYEKNYNDTMDNVLPRHNREFADKAWTTKEYWLDYTSLTGAITCPVFIMTGEKDFAIGPEHYKQFVFPNKTIVKYIGGHAPFQEEPQWYAEKITFFFHSLSNQKKLPVKL